MKYCTHCGNELLDEAVICPKCGCEAKKPTSTIDVAIKKEAKPIDKDNLFGLLLMIDLLVCGVLLVVSSILTIWSSFISGYILNLVSLIFAIPTIAITILRYVYGERKTSDKYSFVGLLCFSIFLIIHFILWICMVASLL